MSQCVCMPKCIFFNDQMANMPNTAERMKNRYCLGDNTNCARFLVFSALGREHVPADLFPQNLERARLYIEAGIKQS